MKNAFCIDIYVVRLDGKKRNGQKKVPKNGKRRTTICGRALLFLEVGALARAFEKCSQSTALSAYAPSVSPDIIGGKDISGF